MLFEDSNREFYRTLNSLTEIFYILCRKLGFNIAKNKLETLLEARAFQVISSTDLIIMTGKYKYKRAISLSDCFVIGLAKYTGGSALFANREKEIDHESTKELFDIDILFLEELEK